MQETVDAGGTTTSLVGAVLTLQMQETVDAGGTTTKVHFFDIYDLQTGDRSKQTRWLLKDCLGMAEMACVVICNPHR